MFLAIRPEPHRNDAAIVRLLLQRLQAIQVICSDVEGGFGKEAGVARVIPVLIYA